MKKVGICLSVIGAIMVIAGIVLRAGVNRTALHIEGADGATVVFAAGRLGSASVAVDIIFGILIVVIGVALVIKGR